jgi:hypothetical protein
MKNALLYLAAASLGTAATANAQSVQPSPNVMPQEIQHVVTSVPNLLSPVKTAKSTVSKFRQHTTHDAILRQLTGSGHLNNANKTTSTVTDERLIAKSYHGYADLDGSGIPVWLLLDSADYHYFGERQSWFNFNNMNYADYYSLYSGQPIGLGQVFGGRDRDGKSEILADSAHHYGPVSSATPEMYMTNYQVFDASDNIVDYTDFYTPWSFGLRMMMNFDANNRPTSVKYLQYSGPGWDTTERRYVTYNADTVTSDSTSVYSSTWDPEHKLAYTYDGTGKTVSVSEFDYDGSTWYEAYRYDIDYYTSGKIRQMTTRFAAAAGNPLDTTEVDTIGWTAGVPYMTYMEGRYIEGGTISQQYFMTKHINTADGLPDTTRTVQYNFSMTPADTMDMMTTYVYDSYANPTMSTTWGKTTPSAATYDTLNNIQHFYYELYTRDNTGVNNVATGGFQIYPNPANADLFITQGISTATLATVKMFDITGRTVISTTAGNSGNTRINMSSLPQGTYMVLLQDANGNVLQREKVVKL